MIPSCDRHRFETSEDQCRECHLSFCGDCLVYTNGANARPLCIQCALKRSGVRSSGGSKSNWRERRAQAKASKEIAKVREAAAARKAEATERPARRAGEGEGRVSLDASRWDLGSL